MCFEFLLDYATHLVEWKHVSAKTSHEYVVSIQEKVREQIRCLQKTLELAEKRKTLAVRNNDQTEVRKWIRQCLGFKQRAEILSSSWAKIMVLTQKKAETALNISILQALDSSTRDLKSQNAQMNEDKVESILENLSGEMEVVREVSQMLSTPLPTTDDLTLADNIPNDSPLVVAEFERLMAPSQSSRESGVDLNPVIVVPAGRHRQEERIRLLETL